MSELIPKDQTTSQLPPSQPERQAVFLNPRPGLAGLAVIVTLGGMAHEHTGNKQPGNEPTPMVHSIAHIPQLELSRQLTASSLGRPHRVVKVHDRRQPQKEAASTSVHQSGKESTQHSESSQEKSRQKATKSMQAELHFEHQKGQALLRRTPGIVIPSHKEKRQPEKLKKLPLEGLAVPAETEAYLQANTVHIPLLGCSGLLVRNETGTAIGIRTAEHCGLRSQDQHWGADADGKPTINVRGPIQANIGDSVDAMSPAGTVTQLALNALNDTEKDQAYGAFESNAVSDVMANSNQMSPAEIAALRPGIDVIYSSGWAVNQPLNPGVLRRHSFGMPVLGTDSVTTTLGETIKLIMTAVPENQVRQQDGSECSWGYSGSIGLVPDGHGGYREVGTASAFDDFGLLHNKDNPKNATQVRRYIEHKFGFSMDGFAGICGFAYEMPGTEENMTIANVSQEQVPETGPPGFEEITQLQQEYRHNFFKPTYTRHIMHGLVRISGGKGDYWLRNPAYLYDTTFSTLLLGYYADQAEGKLSLVPIAVEGVPNITVYGEPRPGDNNPDSQTGSNGKSGNSEPGAPETSNETAPDLTTTSTGDIIQQPGKATDFVDEHGLHFGSLLLGEQIPTGKAYTLNVDNNQLQLVAAAEPRANGIATNESARSSLKVRNLNSAKP